MASWWSKRLSSAMIGIGDIFLSLGNRWSFQLRIGCSQNWILRTDWLQHKWSVFKFSPGWHRCEAWCLDHRPRGSFSLSLYLSLRLCQAWSNLVTPSALISRLSLPSHQAGQCRWWDPFPVPSSASRFVQRFTCYFCSDIVKCHIESALDRHWRP